MDAHQQASLARLRALLNSPDSDPVEIADCYVNLLGEQLQKLASEGYKRHGRGLIEIDLRGVDLRSATGGLPITYYPLADASDDWPASLDDLLPSYDPQRETVVLLYHDSSEPLVYVLE
jgi:hypothetical protein